jgi:photosystem II stability/assembly factor-like uncharacterized protein
MHLMADESSVRDEAMKMPRHRIVGWLWTGTFSLCLPAFPAWRSLGPFGGPAEAILVAPHNSSLLLAATRNALVYRSDNRGSHWVALPFSGSLSFSVRTMRVSGGDAPAYYLGGIPGLPNESGLYRSTDDGNSWRPLVGMQGKSVYSLATWDKDPNVVAAGCHDGVYLSTDGGDSWARISPPGHLELQPVTSLAIDPAVRDVIYAGTTHLPWKTEDGGRNWTSIHRGMLDDSDVFSIDIDAASPSHILASACSGIYLSENAGQLWSKLLGVPRTSRRTYTIRRDPLNRLIIYAGTSQGLWKSEDGGAAWRKISDSIVKSIAFDRSGGRVYLATDDAGLLVTGDNGRSFQQINEGFVNRSMRHLAEFEDGFYSSSPYDSSGGKLHRMSFGGDWTMMKSGGGSGNSNLLAVVSAGGRMLIGRTQDGIVRSADGGKTWTGVRGWQGRVRALAAIDSGLLFLGTTEGLYSSRDFGDRWTAIKPAMPIDGLYAAKGQIVADAGQLLLLSQDEGGTWTTAPSPTRAGELYDLAIGGKGVFLAATAQGALRSTNAGQTWKFSSGGLGRGTVRCVAFARSESTAVAIQHGVVYHSGDAGVTWAPLDMKGVEGAFIVELVIPDAAPDRIFAATRARGVFVAPLPQAESALP